MDIVVKDNDLLQLVASSVELAQLKRDLFPLQMTLLLAEAHHEELHDEIDYIREVNSRLHEQLVGVRMGRDLAEEDLAHAREQNHHMAEKLNEYKRVSDRRLDLLAALASENRAVQTFLFEKGLELPPVNSYQKSLVDVDLLGDLLHALFTKPGDKLNIARLVHKLTGLSPTECNNLVIEAHSEDVPIEVVLEETPVVSTGTPYMSGVQTQQEFPIVTFFADDVDDDEDTMPGNQSGITPSFDARDTRIAGVL